MVKYYEDIKGSYDIDKSHLASITGNGVWLKENIGSKTNIIKSKKIDGDLLFDVSIYSFENDVLVESIEAKTANILNIAIGKSFQNKGHGSKMVYNYLKSLPPKCTVLLEVKKNNYKALKIYSKLNFQKLYIRKAYYNDGADAVNMRLVK